jgi:predicted DNA-binding transcriptional regulator AlpA
MSEQTILNINECASLLRVSKRSVYEYVSARGKEKMKANPFPCLRIGDRVLFVREDILTWINRQKEVAA